MRAAPDSDTSGRDSSEHESSSDDSEHPVEAVLRNRAAASGTRTATLAAAAAATQLAPARGQRAELGGMVAKTGGATDAASHGALQPKQPSGDVGLAGGSGNARLGGGSSTEPAAGRLRDLDRDLLSEGDASEDDPLSGSTSSSAEVQPAVPTGVVLVDSIEPRNAAMQRLLRAPRYYDEDYEEAAIRCFKCGGKGHIARDCTAQAKERSCYLCAQFGHDSRECPSSLCWRCQRPGHMARDCPCGHRQQASWDEPGGPPLCLRCGSETCPCAGQPDFVRAESGCQREYSEWDLQHTRCYVCGRRGHLACAAAPTQVAKLSCHNCGQGGHTAGECARELPQVLRGERLAARSAPSVASNDWGSGDGASFRGQRGSYAAAYTHQHSHGRFSAGGSPAVHARYEDSRQLGASSLAGERRQQYSYDDVADYRQGYSSSDARGYRAGGQAHGRSAERYKRSHW